MPQIVQNIAKELIKSDFHQEKVVATAKEIKALLEVNEKTTVLTLKYTKLIFTLLRIAVAEMNLSAYSNETLLNFIKQIEVLH